MTQRSWQGSWGAVCYALCGVGLCVTRAVAASGGHQEDHAASPLDLVFPAINFLLFAYLIRRAGGDTVRSYLRQRRREVVQALDAAARAKAEADQVHADVRARLGQVEEEAKRLRADMRAAAELDRERRLTAARQAVGRIVSDARLGAEHEVRAAVAALRDETVRGAVVETVALLRRQIKDADQERFVGDFVQGVQPGG